MQPLIGEFKEAREKFIQLVDGFPKEKRESVLFDQWSLKDILAHLTGWANYQIETLKQFKNREKIFIAKNLKNSINEDFVNKRKKWSWKKVYLEFLKFSANLVKEYESLPTALWQKKIYKETTPADFIKIEINHYRKTHGLQIKKALKSFFDR